MKLRLFSLLILLIFVGLGCGNSSEAEKLATKSVKLEVWRVFDDDSTWRDIMDAYRALHPNVSFDYRELRLEEYEDELIRAFAEGTGPDIFSLHNTWIEEYVSLISPMPASVTIPYSEVKGSIKKEKVYTIKEEPTLTERQLKSEFVDVVAKDVLRNGKIVALPLAVDSLVLFSNRNLLNAAGIAEPPATWTEFQQQVIKLTKVSTTDDILQVGAALGTSRNVERAFDILSLLMMQNGTAMLDDRGHAAFAEQTSDTPFALEAVRFYTDFANPLKQVYGWNEKQPNSFDAFASGNTAFFFGYSYHIPFLARVAPKLEYTVSPMPQIDGGKVVNYANYWVETVAQSSNNQEWAWDFIEFAASKNQVMKYLNAAGKPTARRALIEAQLSNDRLFVFASQVLTADSWYRGRSADVAEKAFLDLIDATLSGVAADKALKDAQNKVNQSL